MNAKRVLETDEYGKWVDGLRDKRAQLKIDVRVKRLAAGNPGDCNHVGNGVSNLELITVRDIGLISFRKAIRSLSCLQVEIKVPSLVILRRQKAWLHL